jgi:hypothetical protein
MKPKYTTLLTLGLAATCSLQATTVFTEDFATDATGWSEEGNGTYSYNAGNENLEMAANGGFDSLRYNGFTDSPINLEIGDSITLSVDFSTSITSSGDNALAFGIYLGGDSIDAGFNEEVTGYSAMFGWDNSDDTVRPDGGVYVAINTRGGTTAGTGGAADSSPTLGTTNTGGYFLADTSTHNLTMTITRSSNTEVTIVYGMDGNLTDPVTGTFVDFAYEDLSVFARASDMTSFTIDNITVSIIPEPSTYALAAGLLGLAFVAMRRRK